MIKYSHSVVPNIEVKSDVWSYFLLFRFLTNLNLARFSVFKALLIIPTWLRTGSIPKFLNEGRGERVCRAAALLIEMFCLYLTIMWVSASLSIPMAATNEIGLQHTQQEGQGNIPTNLSL